MRQREAEHREIVTVKAWREARGRKELRKISIYQ